jgi:hypothetical protein
MNKLNQTSKNDGGRKFRAIKAEFAAARIRRDAINRSWNAQDQLTVTQILNAPKYVNEISGRTVTVKFGRAQFAFDRNGKPVVTNY